MLIIRDQIIGNAVLGKLLVDGNAVCDTLENKDKLIPCGAYKVSVSRSPKFGRDLALLSNAEVPATRGVRIHAGNSAKDSSACVLVGFGRCGDNILNSRNAEIAITALARNDPSLIITGNGMV